MQAKGYISEFKKRNEKTGESWFSFVCENSEIFLCHGIILKYPAKMPLIIDYYDVDIHKKEITYATIDKENTNQTITFLCSKEFSSIGRSNADKLLNKITGDIYTYSKNFEPKNFTDNEVDVLVKIKYYTYFQEFYDFLTEKDFDLFNISKIYTTYKTESFDVINNNPYTLLNCGADIVLCEKLAMEKGIRYCDPKRIRALVSCVMKSNNSNGNTRIKFTELVSRVDRLCRKIDVYKETLDHIFIAEEILTEKYIIKNSKKDVYVYNKNDYDTELSISINLQRLSSRKIKFKNEFHIKDTEVLLNIQYDESQLAVFNLINSSGIKLITGDPGSGKTTVMKGLIQEYKTNNPDKRIALCAPTGCAARRLQEQTGMPAITIHRLLELMPYTNIFNTHIPQLNYDLIIVDEASMIDVYIANLLLSAIKYGSIVIFIGDPNQLDPVGAGTFFKSLIDSGQYEHIHLNTIFRQNSRSYIVLNSKKVINSDDNLETSKNFKIIRLDNEQEIIDQVNKYADACYQRKVDFKLFTPSRKSKFSTGSINMNRMLSNIYSKYNNPDRNNEVYFGAYIFRIGDKIIFNQNDYERGFFNGMEGIITSIQKFDNSVYISIETDSGEIVLKDNDIEYIELGYAITAHKAQGSECDNAIIIIPLKPVSLLQKRLLYVEITRARKNVIILTEKGAIHQAINNNIRLTRDTGLLEMLTN